MLSDLRESGSIEQDAMWYVDIEERHRRAKEKRSLRREKHWP